jgi:hypothetical protein
MQRLGRDIDCSGTYLHNSSCTNIFTDKSLTVWQTIISDSRVSTSSKFKPSQLLAELEADDDEGPNTSKQRSPTLSSDDDILDKVGIRKRKLFIAPLDENSDNESASQP